MSAPEVLTEGVVFGESPRWHDGRLWFSDWGANQVIALNADGSHEVVATVPSFPMCIDFGPAGDCWPWTQHSDGCSAVSQPGGHRPGRQPAKPDSF